MKINIEINDKLLKEAMKMSKIATKKDVINKALEEYVRFLHRESLLNLRGKVTFSPNESNPNLK